MATPGISDVIYLGRPKWSVAHHLPVPGVPSPSKSAAFHQLGLHHQRSRIAAGIVLGLLLAAICFAFIQVNRATHTLQQTARPWTDAVVNAKQETTLPEASPQNPSTLPTQAPHTDSAAPTANTSVTINGESVPVPKNGTIHREYTSGDSRSTVDIQVHQSSGP